ncbi:FimB/Mfa2 family fimbrial subunit [Parabacteroides timonensis]|uniref:FimB/Mfa2 family fimbrial subunit n=1 Tax=Parabacteroides timonensis TaxID=1871013 RepID=UPI00094E036B|nr:FimB/Mfa2 family fimbrial subunit [Parabacteroides timonensis]
MRKNTIQSIALSLLFFLGSCSDGTETLPEAPSTGSITIQTRADGVGGYRLLAFSTKDEKCVLNQSIPADGTTLTITLDEGTYHFVSLTGAEQFDLLEAEKTDGLLYNAAISLNNPTTLSEFLLSPMVDVTIPNTNVYAADLQPATCQVKLVLDEKEFSFGEKKPSFSLVNMCGGFCLNGATFSGTVDKGFPLLVDGTTVCLPTDGDAKLSWSIEGDTPKELELGKTFQAGMSYTVTLSYKEELGFGSVTIKDWEEEEQDRNVDATL